MSYPILDGLNVTIVRYSIPSAILFHNLLGASRPPEPAELFVSAGWAMGVVLDGTASTGSSVSPRSYIPVILSFSMTDLSLCFGLPHA